MLPEVNLVTEINLYKKKTKVFNVLTEEVDLAMLCYAEENHVTSLWHIPQQYPSFRYLRYYKKFEYKPYKFGNQQQLFEDDNIKRTEFWETLFNLLNENGGILEKLIFTDKALFCLNATVNAQTYRSVPTSVIPVFVILFFFLIQQVINR